MRLGTPSTHSFTSEKFLEQYQFVLDYRPVLRNVAGLFRSLDNSIPPGENRVITRKEPLARAAENLEAATTVLLPSELSLLRKFGARYVVPKGLASSPDAHDDSLSPSLEQGLYVVTALTRSFSGISPRPWYRDARRAQAQLQAIEDICDQSVPAITADFGRALHDSYAGWRHFVHHRRLASNLTANQQRIDEIRESQARID